MDEKGKRLVPDLDLSLKSPADQEEPSNKVLTLDEAVDFELKHGNVDPNVDLKKLRRTISNRLSAQRARIKRNECIVELEKKVKYLEDKLAIMTPEIENVNGRNEMLRLEIKMLQEQMDSVTNKSKLRTAQMEEMKPELRRLKELEKALKKKA
ncbi:basic leucine zipper 61-like [Lycium ferocissimum]|uniref:basic leucine zipper 61-like n=1 Tax=Lycium ferocissimum TaxID=112874 RepID=UPI00281668D6|nr:basic leucine zipper 61-like [Lycium ferocissimum]